ncbi:MAG: putative sugar O-methyltransferase [Phycisphaerae bacterium]|nr:putative sugar O-methyltransferase [Phycisphaerae bacterium]
MNTKNPFTLQNPFSRFELEGDKALFNWIVTDMIQNGGNLVPSDHWNWNLGSNETELGSQVSEYSDELFEANYSQLQMMLAPWVGGTGMKSIDEVAVAKYEGFLRAIDHLNLLADDIQAHGQSNGWRETDLGSMLDINLITAFTELSLRERVAVCEVGGGYGRLAEVFLSDLWVSVHYVLVDAVPGSLMYSYLYLKSQFPNLRIGSYYNGDIYSENFDCYIMPSWYSHLLPSSSFDISINIESMQEMSQHHVDYYFTLFDRLTKPDGEIYLSNARDYIFRGNWNIPKHWETLFLHNTPRSWSPDHPTHIMRKRNGDFSLERCILEGAFKHQIIAWQQQQLISEQQQHIADRDRICGELQQTITDLTGCQQTGLGLRRFWKIFRRRAKAG